MNDDGRPPIQSLEDLLTEDQLCELLGVRKTALQGWRYGRDDRPKLPYIRLAAKRWYSKAQVAWWFNQWQMSVDKYHIDRQRRLQEGITVGRPFSKRTGEHTDG